MRDAEQKWESHNTSRQFAPRTGTAAPSAAHFADGALHFGPVSGPSDWSAPCVVRARQSTRLAHCGCGDPTWRPALTIPSSGRCGRVQRRARRRASRIDEQTGGEPTNRVSGTSPRARRLLGSHRRPDRQAHRVLGSETWPVAALSRRPTPDAGAIGSQPCGTDRCSSNDAAQAWQSVAGADCRSTHTNRSSGRS
jgi:hypothetical protein